MARLTRVAAIVIFAFAIMASRADARTGRAAQNPLQAEYSQLIALYKSEQWNEVAARAPRLVAELDASDQTRSLRYSQILELNTLALIHSGRFTEAEPYLQKALAWQQATHGPASDAYFGTLEKFAKEYVRLERPQDGERLYRDCTATAERVLGRDHKSVGSCLIRLGAAISGVGGYAEAGSIYRRAIGIYEKALGPEHEWTTAALGFLVILDLDLGQYAEAEAIAKRVIAIDEKRLGPNHPDVANDLHSLAFVYAGLGRPADGEPLVRRALGIQERVPRSANNESYLIYVSYMTSLGTFASALGHTGEAEALFTRALSIYEKLNGPEHPNSARAAEALAELYHRQGRLREAEPLFRRALAIRERRFQASHPERTQTEYELASLYRDLGRTAEAEPLLNMALEGRRGSFGSEHPEYARVLSDLGLIKIAMGNSGQALDLTRRAAAIASASLSKEVGTATPIEARSLRPLFDAQLAALRDAASKDATNTDLNDEAFQTAQRTTQSAAASALGQMSARFGAGSGALAALVREQQDLTNERQGLDRSLVQQMSHGDARNAPLEDNLRRRLAIIDQQLSAVNGRLTREFPEYASLSNPGPLSLSGVQALLSANEALVFLLTGEKTSEAFAVTRETLVWRSISLTSVQLSDKVTRFRRGLDLNEFQKSLADGRPVLFDLAAAHELYQLLLGPLAATIQDKNNLIVVPTGALTSLPFQLLVTEAPTPVKRIEDIPDYRKAKWLLMRHAVSVLPSVASLKALRASRSRAEGTKPLIGFADPVFGKEVLATTVDRRGVAKPEPRKLETGSYTDFWQGAGIDRAKLAGALPRLPDTADELMAVAAQVGAKPEDIFLRKDASETTVKRRVLSDYRVVYFATHGLVAGDIKGVAEPSLALTIPSDPNSLDDGLLTASEIALLRLNADWVVLSACNTIAGDKPGAEALSGLARSFFYAGARALLVSHWAVASDSAARLSISTFANLSSDTNVGRAEALQRAMLTYLNDENNPLNAYPAFWGPFQIVGEGLKR
jgi:CHAT domain-containing protein/Tfp pilus assembly protein PilF